MKVFQIVCGLAAVCLAGCATAVRTASSDEETAAKRFVPHSDSASLFVLRDDPGLETVGSIQLFVSLDGKFAATRRAEEIVQLDPGRFSRVELPAGKHELLCLYTAKKDSGIRITGTPLDLETGHLYFISVNPQQGLRRADTGTAQYAIVHCDLIPSATVDGRGTMLLVQPPAERGGVKQLRLENAKGEEQIFYLQSLR